MRTYAESGGKRDALVADCLVPPLLHMLSPPPATAPATASTDDSESDNFHIAAASEVLGQVSAISRMLTYALRVLTYITYAYVCLRMLTYAYVC
jgi:hypothetical protein